MNKLLIYVLLFFNCIVSKSMFFDINLNNINNFKKSLYKEIKYTKNNNFYINTKILDTYLDKNYLNTKIINSSKEYSIKSINREILFLLNKNNKIYLHIQKLISFSNIYHIGISFKSVFNTVRYDLRGYNFYFPNHLLSDNLEEFTIFWDYTNKTLIDIIEYEKNMEHKYILGIYDCRHYVKNLSLWSTGKSTPVWNLTNLLKKN